MVSANRLHETADEARAAPAGEMRLLFCRSCGFVFNGAFDLSLVPYGDDYENNQSNSGRFMAHMQEMAERVRASSSGAPLQAIEVGCGQGDFLKLLRKTRPLQGDAAVGFDPSYDGKEVPGCTIYKSYFDAKALDKLTFLPNAVFSRHVIEHIPQPLEILRTVRAALERAPQAHVFFETPCINWIFRNNAFWDLCYEHCSYFTAESLAFAFARAGFETKDVSHVFGDQYLWIESVPARVENSLPVPDERIARRFVENTAAFKTQWHDKLTDLAKRGKVAVWGAATKGATFVQELDPEAKLVHCLIDINPLKQNKYVPLTAHPVVDRETAIANGVSTIILTNPNYADEIKAMLGDHAARMAFVPL